MIQRLSTHLLDTAAGRPGAGVPVVLTEVTVEASVLGRATTDEDGRVHRLNDEPLEPGDYRVVLDVADHMRRHHGTAFHPTIAVHVRLGADREHYHLPVLASPFSYTTYLGS